MQITRYACTGRLSKVLKAGNTVYLSGLTARDKGGDIAAQTSDIIRQIEEYLALAGTDRTRLVKVNIWLNAIEDFEAMNAVWDAWVDPENQPVRATVESKLAGTGNLVEMMAEAVV